MVRDTTYFDGKRDRNGSRSVSPYTRNRKQSDAHLGKEVQTVQYKGGRMATNKQTEKQTFLPYANKTRREVVEC